MEQVTFISNRTYGITNSRIPILRNFQKAGWQASVLSEEDETAHKLHDARVQLSSVNIARRAFSPISDAKAFMQVRKYLYDQKPSLVHTFNAKPLYLVASCRYRHLYPSARFVATITGLGSVYLNGGIGKHISAYAYKIASSKVDALIFQNKDDRDLFIANKWVSIERSHIISGAGVDTTRYRPSNTLLKEIRVLMAGRILHSKGIVEFTRAAKALRNEFPNCIFSLAGEVDAKHPDTIRKDEFELLISQSGIEYIGRVSDMPKRLQSSTIFVLPSHREGMPRTNIEAAACGVPVVTTNAPGCRETVIDGETGFIVPVKDAEALTEALRKLLSDESLRTKMGKAGREYACAKFDSEIITQQHLELYASLGIDINKH